MKWLRSFFNRNSHLEPNEIFNLLNKKFRLFYRVNLLDIFDPNYIITLTSYIPFYFGCTFVFLTFYTLIAYDFEIGLQCLTFLGITLQGLTKNLTITRGMNIFQELFTFLNALYMSNVKNPKNKAVLKRSVNITMIACYISLFLFTLTALAIACIPFVEYWLTGSMGFMISVFIPAMDETTSIGFAFTTLYHCLILFMGYTGTCAADITCLMVILHTWPLSDIFALYVEDLNRTLLDYNVGGGGSKALVWLKLRNILMMHKEFYKCVYICDFQIYFNFFEN